MCGIVAAFNGSAKPHRLALSNALGLLHHRGPDAADSWTSPDESVTLCHTRLSIIDLLTGTQPLSNEDGSIRAVVSGEFYGFEEIRAELERLGHRFRSQSDSEIALHLYEEFGPDFVSRLDGEFALVLWDGRKKLLLAARDRFGIKPLFYSNANGPLALASEIKALHSAGIESAWDEQSFFERLVLDGCPDGRTLFRGVREIPPGYTLLATANQITLRRYWDFNYPLQSEEHPNGSDDDYAEELRRLIDLAVHSRMRADVPVGCYLSGGIDSASILALMSRHATYPVSAFTICFGDPDYDESAAAREIARHAGAQFIPVPITQATLAADFSDAVWHAETLFSNAHGVAKFALSRAVHEAGFKAVLTGEGADEIFAGYSFFVRDAIRGSPPAEKDALGSAMGLSEADFRTLLAPQCPSKVSEDFRDRLGYVPGWIEAREAVLQNLQPILPDAFSSTHVYTSLLDTLDVPARLSGRAPLNQSLYIYAKTALPGYILTVLGDRMEMAHSVEGRLPFFATGVVEFARTLPCCQKVRGTVEKFVLRKAMRGVLPAAQCSQRKQAFQTPPALLNPGEPLHLLMQDILRSRLVQKVPFIKQDKLIGALDHAMTMDGGRKAMFEMSLMPLLSACVLADRFQL